MYKATPRPKTKISKACSLLLRENTNTKSLFLPSSPILRTGKKIKNDDSNDNYNGKPFEEISCKDNVENEQDTTNTFDALNPNHRTSNDITKVKEEKASLKTKIYRKLKSILKNKKNKGTATNEIQRGDDVSTAPPSMKSCDIKDVGAMLSKSSSSSKKRKNKNNSNIKNNNTSKDTGTATACTKKREQAKNNNEDSNESNCKTNTKTSRRRRRRRLRRSAPLNLVARPISPVIEKRSSPTYIYNELFQTNILLAKRLENMKMNYTKTCLKTHQLQKELLNIRTEISMFEQIQQQQ